MRVKLTQRQFEQKGRSDLTLTILGQRTAVIDDREGIRFMMNYEGRFVRVLVSRHALEDIDTPCRWDGTVDRFNEYRRQFEEIACEKIDRGLVEQDGTVCIRGRDLPGHGTH
jgi:hypothetical protein